MKNIIILLATIPLLSCTLPSTRRIAEVVTVAATAYQCVALMDKCTRQVEAASDPAGVATVTARCFGKFVDAGCPELVDTLAGFAK